MKRIWAVIAVVLMWSAMVASPSVDAQQSGITGDLPSSGGFGLIVWAGGPVEEIDAAAQAEGCDLTSVFATEDGRFVAYVVGAPDFVNAAFIVAVGFDVPPGTALAVVCSSPLAGEPDSFTIDFIDVGQGDATLITVNGDRLLIDGGRSQDRIETRLSALGITDLDAILSTHPDADHIAGLVRVLELYEIERVYLNGGASDSQTFATYLARAHAEGAEVVTIQRGDTVALGGLALDVLHPGPLTGESNDDSAVVQLDCGSVSVLLTGDATEASEQSMLATGVVDDVDVLKVGHHGSSTSTTQQFLDAVAPEHAVISAGLDNQYGHPHPEVVARLTAIGAVIYETDTTFADDTVTMTSDCSTFAFAQAGG